eukprot:TRINITY_DN3482_c0_g1_i2.p1 TRINITY_DN3482_c0_g1~~TRINITY_DN3482_c0_g1_i2.p1  ORF type:complete len:115 (-),score=14.77 TRINITY_DN3482_c0_g1_i2:550-894(-)
MYSHSFKCAKEHTPHLHNQTIELQEVGGQKSGQKSGRVWATHITNINDTHTFLPFTCHSFHPHFSRIKAFFKLVFVLQLEVLTDENRFLSSRICVASICSLGITSFPFKRVHLL